MPHYIAVMVTQKVRKVYISDLLANDDAMTRKLVNTIT